MVWISFIINNIVEAINHIFEDSCEVIELVIFGARAVLLSSFYNHLDLDAKSYKLFVGFEKENSVCGLLYCRYVK